MLLSFNNDEYWVQEFAYFLRIEAASGSPVRKQNKEKVIEICRVSNDIKQVAIVIAIHMEEYLW